MSKPNELSNPKGFNGEIEMESMYVLHTVVVFFVPISGSPHCGQGCFRKGMFHIVTSDFTPVQQSKGNVYLSVVGSTFQGVLIHVQILQFVQCLACIGRTAPALQFFDSFKWLLPRAHCFSANKAQSTAYPSTLAKRPRPKANPKQRLFLIGR